LLGDQHRQRRENALAHLRLGDADDHGVVGLDHDPGGDLADARRCGARSRTEWDAESQRQRAARCRDAGEKRPTAERARHGSEAGHGGPCRRIDARLTADGDTRHSPAPTPYGVAKPWSGRATLTHVPEKWERVSRCGKQKTDVLCPKSKAAAPKG